ncbi:gamma carbonic anhydrase family protein [Roseimaritima ulvae]|uniref:Putative lipopolysaccharide biosynthesis O-acetyl transferase WbbJ n=1 Tax=Roseimaritima ulvae TaxID=980254 RepID=A0A5B9QLV6_9BACT|nr:gamma carbonic anhydrase family protein [Roseimaritima ulvae]QEG39924.1 putative lipopolysaccharide biosynthesis O-acetyl transferase WbbJ [Roseimaritima ulvae]
MAIYQLGERTPQIADDCYVPAEATVIGDVRLEPQANLWPGAVLRGDVEPIVVGPQSSIQDGSVLHTDPGCPLTIGCGVTVGHQATLHGCTIGDHSLIGMQAIVLNRAVIGKDCLVGAAALVTEGKSFPERSLIIGTPAKRVRDLTDEEVENLRHIALRYVDRAKIYREQLKLIVGR